MDDDDDKKDMKPRGTGCGCQPAENESKTFVWWV